MRCNQKTKVMLENLVNGLPAINDDNYHVSQETTINENSRFSLWRVYRTNDANGCLTKSREYDYIYVKMNDGKFEYKNIDKTKMFEIGTIKFKGNEHHHLKPYIRPNGYGRGMFSGNIALSTTGEFGDSILRIHDRFEKN